MERNRHSRRDPTFSDFNAYTEPAIVCADSVDADPSVTMDVIFAEVLTDTRAVSHTCAYPCTAFYALPDVSPQQVGAYWPIPGQRCSYWPVRAVERYQGPWNNTFANRSVTLCVASLLLPSLSTKAGLAL